MQNKQGMQFWAELFGGWVIIVCFSYEMIYRRVVNGVLQIDVLQMA